MWVGGPTSASRIKVCQNCDSSNAAIVNSNQNPVVLAANENYQRCAMSSSGVIAVSTVSYNQGGAPHLSLIHI